jgi:N-acetylglucosaminyldiphosphoundecaprenol N-acetyl-beta-D-mannosaminyltransferase
MSRVHLFGVDVDVLTMNDAVETIAQSTGMSGECRFVVTPNLDHVVLLENHDQLKAAYEDADLVLADGWPVVLASRFLGKPLPERVTGSDLVPALFDHCQRNQQPLRVYLLGAGPGVAKRAAANIHHKWPLVEVVGTYSPPLGFQNDAAGCRSIVVRINAARPDILVLGLGAPKQELWIHQHFRDISAGWALCVGATIDFLAGEKRRAPRWMQKLCLEWLFRLGSEPKRLFKRYWHEAITFPRLLFKEWRSTTQPAMARPREAATVPE